MLRHLRNLAIVWLAAAAVISVAWLSMYLLANRRFDRATAKLVSLGLPSKLADLQRPEIPDAQNASVGFRKAASLLSTSVWGPSNGNTTYDLDVRPIPPGWWADANASATANAQVFPLSLAAAKLSDSDEHLSYDKGVLALINSPGYSFNELRALSSTLVDEAVRLHFTQQDGAAIDMMSADSAVAEVHFREPVLIDYLVGTGIESLAMDNLPRIASDLSVGNASPAATPTQIRALIARLLRGRQPIVDRALQGDFLFDANRLSQSGRNAWLVHPLYVASAALALKWAAMPTANPTDRIGPLVAAWPQLPAWSDRAQMRTTVQTIEAMAQASGNFAAASLAVALYRADHAGQFPPALDALVPNYLPEIPTDPMSSKGGEMGYLLAAHGQRPMLFLAGDGPAPTADYIPPPAPSYHPNMSRGTTPPYFLDLAHITTPAPTTAPTTP